jgi:hypothetical protein
MAMPYAQAAAAPQGRIGKFRWTICGLLFLAATINYVDRQVIGILKPTLQQQYGWSEIDYADIVFAFQLAYAIGFLFAGTIIDRLGIKRGLRHHGIPRESLQGLSRSAFDDSCHKTNIRPCAQADLLNLYEESWRA